MPTPALEGRPASVSPGVCSDLGMRWEGHGAGHEPGRHVHGTAARARPLGPPTTGASRLLHGSRTGRNRAIRSGMWPSWGNVRVSRRAHQVSFTSRLEGLLQNVGLGGIVGEVRARLGLKESRDTSAPRASDFPSPPPRGATQQTVVERTPRPRPVVSQPSDAPPEPTVAERTPPRGAVTTDAVAPSAAQAATPEPSRKVTAKAPRTGAKRRSPQHGRRRAAREPSRRSGRPARLRRSRSERAPRRRPLRPRPGMAARLWTSCCPRCAAIRGSRISSRQASRRTSSCGHSSPSISHARSTRSWR